MLQSKRNGFTLVELMVTVVIISILAGIALPSYRQYVIRSKRSAAQAAMMDIANRQQQFLIANRAYAAKATLEANGYVLPAEIAESYTWDVQLGAGPAPSFVIIFTGTGAQATDNSPGPLRLTNSGAKMPSEKWQR